MYHQCGQFISQALLALCNYSSCIPENNLYVAAIEYAFWRLGCSISWNLLFKSATVLQPLTLNKLEDDVMKASSSCQIVLTKWWNNRSPCINHNQTKGILMKILWLCLILWNVRGEVGGISLNGVFCGCWLCLLFRDAVESTSDEITCYKSFCLD